MAHVLQICTTVAMVIPCMSANPISQTFQAKINHESWLKTAFGNTEDSRSIDLLQLRKSELDLPSVICICLLARIAFKIDGFQR